MPASRQRTLELNVGIDFGTSTTKVCVRQALGLDADVDVFPVFLESDHELLCPSLVTVEGGKLFFGHAAAKRSLNEGAQAFPHLKVCLACSATGRKPLSDCSSVRSASGCHGRFEMTSPCDAADLVTCFLAWVMAAARAELPDVLQGVRDTRFTYSIGVPVAQLDEPGGLDHVYRRVVQAAERLSFAVHQGIGLADGLAAARAALAEPLAAEAESPVQLCPEAGAAMVSYLVSPTTLEGVYGLVDVGAWTTDMSVFKLTDLIGDHAGERSVEYLAAASERVALNDVDEALAEWLSGSRDTRTAVDRARRWREGRAGGRAIGLMAGGREIDLSGAVDDAAKGVGCRILDAFRAIMGEARSRAPMQSFFMDVPRPVRGQPQSYVERPPEGRLEMFAAGGGVAEPLLWEPITGIPVVRGISPLPALQLSSQLSPAMESRFAVALGLAFPSTLWPHSFGPSRTPPFSRPRVRPRFDVDDM